MIKKFWLISDTHCNHEQLKIPEVDLVIHAGDSTNRKGFYNTDQALEFFEWYNNLPIKDKFLIAGNHDYSLYVKAFNLEEYSFKYIEQNSGKYFGNHFYGTPYTPEFGNWYFMLNEEKAKIHANNIPPCDILITHGPPKFILDSVYREGIFYEHCGDLNLYHRIVKLKPKFHVFGHIHSSYNNKYPENNGIFFNGDTWFINASCCVDGDMNKIYTHGFICEYNVETKEVIKIYRNE